MPTSDDQDLDEEAARLLRAARPEPGPQWMARTEARLLGRRAAPRRRRPVIAAFGISGAVAAVAVVASLAGAGPLALDGQDDVRAGEDCRTVQVTTPRTTGEIVRQPDGTATVVQQDETVTKPVRRCR